MDASTEDLNAVWSAGGSTAAVRPWLQAFTASFLDHYIDYGPEEIRQQIQAVMIPDMKNGLLWNASVRYDSGGLLTEEEADLEAAAGKTGHHAPAADAPSHSAKVWRPHLAFSELTPPNRRQDFQGNGKDSRKKWEMSDVETKTTGRRNLPAF